MAGVFKALRELGQDADLLEKMRLNFLLRTLAARNAAPRHVELTPVAGCYFASVYDSNPSRIISESVSMGFAASPTLAALKGVTEYIERRAFRYGRESGLASCATARSDGFAAFPQFLRRRRSAHQTARLNAWHEAVERYCWAVWWDNPTIRYDTLEPGFLQTSPASARALLQVAGELVPLHSLSALVLRPSVVNVQVIILLGRTQRGGYVTGGAACSPGSQEGLMRAASEFYRHCLALRRMQEGGLEAESFYQKRLLFFGSGDGRDLVEARLRAGGKKELVLPALAFDEAIAHPHEDLIHVHRCLFEDQPPFVGGALERLCL